MTLRIAKDTEGDFWAEQPDGRWIFLVENDWAPPLPLDEVALTYGPLSFYEAL